MNWKRISIATLFIFIACNEDVNKQDNTVDEQQTGDLSNVPFAVFIQHLEASFFDNSTEYFDCSELLEFYPDDGYRLDTKNLVQVDSSLCAKLFSNYTNEYGPFCQSYLFKIGRKIHHFITISVVQYFGVVDSPVILLLFDENGEIVNSLEVANLYGEGGGCLNSEFINDSTIIQTYEWREFSIDEETGNDIWETEFLEIEIIVKSNGEKIERELDRWMGEDKD